MSQRTRRANPNLSKVCRDWGEAIVLGSDGGVLGLDGGGIRAIRLG